MRLMIASDLHGSVFYTKKLLEAFCREKCGRLLLLGDILYHGPRNALPAEYDPKTLAGMLNEKKKNLLAVRGNCDTEVDQMVLEFPILADYAVILLGERMLYAAHGHRGMKNLPLQNGDLFLQGHTHVPACQEENGILRMNPGSVSMPKENSHHQYMLYEDGIFLWKDFAGTITNRKSLQ